MLSRNEGQKSNTHWIERANERQGAQVSDPAIRKKILQEIKSAIQENNHHCVTKSTKDENRFIVRLNDGSHVVVARN